MTLPDIMFWQKKCVETRLNPVEPEVFSSLGSRPGDSAPWTRTRQSTCPQAGQFIGQNDNCEVNSEVNPNKSCWFIHLKCFTKSCWTNQSAVYFYHIRSKISTYFLSAGGVLVNVLSSAQGLYPLSPANQTSVALPCQGELECPMLSSDIIHHWEADAWTSDHSFHNSILAPKFAETNTNSLAIWQWFVVSLTDLLRLCDSHDILWISVNQVPTYKLRYPTYPSVTRDDLQLLYCNHVALFAIRVIMVDVPGKVATSTWSQESIWFNMSYVCSGTLAPADRARSPPHSNGI